MTKLKIKNIKGNISIERDKWDKLHIISQFLFGFLLVLLTAFIAFEGLPKIEEIVKNISSVATQQPININASIDVFATLYRNVSIINFDVPKNMIKDGTFETLCYIKNDQGNSIYVIKELGFTSPILKLNEKHEFPCEIKNGKVYRILEP